MRFAAIWRVGLAVNPLASWKLNAIWLGSMRSGGLSLAMLAAAATAYSASAQDSDKPTWSLKASTPAAKLIGEWELSNSSDNAREGQVPSAASMAQVGVTKGTSFQLTVKLVSPAGVVTDVTGSPKLIYRPKGCMSIAANGITTVLRSASAPWTCNTGDTIPLTVIYADQATGVAAVNMYLFKIN